MATVCLRHGLWAKEHGYFRDIYIYHCYLYIYIYIDFYVPFLSFVIRRLLEVVTPSFFGIIHYIPL